MDVIIKLKELEANLVALKTFILTTNHLLLVKFCDCLVLHHIRKVTTAKHIQVFVSHVYHPLYHPLQVTVADQTI